jgi:hypothetical protein
MRFSNLLIRKKSVEKFCEEFHFTKTKKEKLRVARAFILYVRKYTLEELLFFNLRCNGNQYFSRYHYYFLTLLTIIGFYIGLLNHPYGDFLFVLAPSSIAFFPLFSFAFFSKRIREEKIIWNKFVWRFVVNVFENILILITSCSILVILINIVICLFMKLVNNKLVTSSLLKITELLNIYPFPRVLSGITVNLIQGQQNTYLYLPVKFLIYLHEFKIGSVEGNQLCLAGFFFSLAIGGTVVLSLIDRYFEEGNIFRENLLDQIESLNKLIEGRILCNSNGSLLSLNLSDIVILNNNGKRFRNLNFKETIKFNNDNVKTFESNLFNIQKKLNSGIIEENRKILNKYDLFFRSLIFTYAAGILTIFVPTEYSNFLLALFIVDSLILVLILIYIYKDYKDKKYSIEDLVTKDNEEYITICVDYENKKYILKDSVKKTIGELEKEKPLVPET